MAAMKNYAGLPDVDLEQEEIYETQLPDLTEDSTLQETSDDDSLSGHSDFDTTALDPTRARSRFEPSVVDATHVNFSDTVAGRRSYRTRRKYEVEPETIKERLARLTRETVELEAQMQSKQPDQAQDSHEDQPEVDALKARLRCLAGTQKGTVEDEFLRRLDGETPRKREQIEPMSVSTISAITEFSDRLTVLENVLGGSSRPVESVVPTLESLGMQIEVLSATLAPRADRAGTAHLDGIAAKIRELVGEAEKLEASRKAAARAFEELLEARDRNAHTFHGHGDRLRPQSQVVDQGSRKDDMQQQFTRLFLDDQAAKIDALYNVLPTIQDLQPLLPTVLERLRALTVVHAGAADVKGDLDEMERRMAVQEEDIKKWRQGVERAEASIEEGKTTIKNNVHIIGNAVRALEQRVQTLKR